MVKAKNRNYQRIDSKIVSAYKDLLKQGKAEDVSITDLCQTAEVNRTTFYKHYKNTLEVLETLQTNFINDYFSFKNYTFREFVHNPKDGLNALITELMKDQNYYTKLFGYHYVFKILQKIHLAIMKNVNEKSPEIITKWGVSQITTDILYFIGGAAISILSFIRGETPKDMTQERIIELISDALALSLKGYSDEYNKQ